jgi:zinc transporter ZupT
MSIEDSIDHLLNEQHDLEHLHDEGSSFDIQDWKILSICLFPLIGILGISLAAILGTRAGNKLWFTCGVMFSSGILLAGALTHALPHANEMFAALLGEDEEHGDESHQDESDALEEHDEDHHLRYLEEEDHHDEKEEEHSHQFPWANMIFGLTFYLLLVLEAYAERFIDNYVAKNGGKDGNFFYGAHDGHRDEDDGGHKEHDHADDHTDEDSAAEEETNKQVGGGQYPMFMSKLDENNATTESISMRRGSSGGLSPHLAPPSRKNRSESIKLEVSEAFSTSKKEERGSSRWLVTAKHPSVIGFKTEDVNEMIMGQQDMDEKQTINPWVAILLLIVLSVHVLLEGLTIGSAQDLSALKSTFIAIVSHKLFGAFALGSSFVTAGYWQPENRKMFFVLSFIYAGMDVLGLGLGMALSSTFEEDSFAFAILQAMLGGSFLFVSAVELIPGELEKMRVFKFPLSVVMLSLGSGYALMSLIGKWV